MLELFTLDCGLGSQIWAAEFSNIHKRAPAYRSPLTPLGTLCKTIQNPLPRLLCKSKEVGSVTWH